MLLPGWNILCKRYASVSTIPRTLYKKLHPGISMLSCSDWSCCQSLANADKHRHTHRKRLENDNEHLLHNFVPLQSLPLWILNCALLRMQQTTAVFKNCCSVCSDATNALCGLHSKQGSSCLVKHIAEVAAL